jgi:nitroreductase
MKAKPPGQTQAVDVGCPAPEVIRELVRAAILAPSMHNTQPWLFRVSRDSQTIALSLDPARMLRRGDPHGRGAHIAGGAALFNLRIAVAAAGREPVVRLLPEPAEPLLLAVVRLAGPHRPDEGESELHAAIPARRTNRQPFSGHPVPAGILAELVDAAKLEGAALHLPGRDETSRLLRLVAAAERDLLDDPDYAAELAQWVGGNRLRDGIPDAVLGPRDPRGPTPVRSFASGRRRPVNYAWFEQSPQLAVLSTVGGAPLDWLRAGQALQRVLLTATVHGIAVAPLTPPLETADAWLVRDVHAGIEKPQMILRLGYGLPVPAAPRRPVSEFLDEQP